jgi:hypothetical protein
MDDKHYRTLGSGTYPTGKNQASRRFRSHAAFQLTFGRLGGVLSQYIRNEFLYTSDEEIEILFPEENPIFKIHEIVCVRG